ncbi:unnamed protein product [Hermetia illucens]|uniref:Rhodanese domain-containing protein n=1 Tax=Hermetia illucens TaxID=343691 RepID=A0A7R8UHH7_HERIL|nr:rhodanese domain-containing protein CG4456-like [Hermetia illucens]XP_037907342.1 rhodanese domain-containing protein CG4456-like [Hermetia illucens]CAD7080637.1 unnamed protein product [Hermetia illucens]
MATYEEVKDLPNQPSKFLIDVRNLDEVQQTGQIPTSIVIPLPKLEEALRSSNDAFKKTYNREKPSNDAVIIFHCKLGGRAQKATDVAKSLGFKNAKCYKGSWEEWAKKQNIKK